jgi:hypothetical protein
MYWNLHMGVLTLYNSVLILIWLLSRSERIYLVASIILNRTVFLLFSYGSV